MSTVLETMHESCEMRHRDTVTMRQLVGFVAGIATFILGLAFAAGAAQVRLNAVDDSVKSLETERTATMIKLATLENDIAWQSEVLRQMAGKMDINPPSRRK